MPITDAGFVDGADISGADLLQRVGPTLIVRVSIGPPHPVLSGPRPPDAGITVADVPALIDTGAFESCIDQDLADQLALTLVDRRVISGAGGRHDFNVYLAEIEIPGLLVNQYGLFTAVRLAEGGAIHRVLLGRTLLRELVVIYDGRRGVVTMCR
jgi:predicted aspartyl protease